MPGTVWEPEGSRDDEHPAQHGCSAGHRCSAMGAGPKKRQNSQGRGAGSQRTCRSPRVKVGREGVPGWANQGPPAQRAEHAWQPFMG